MTQKRTYVEFVGMHTSGKTTIIKEIVHSSLLEPLCAVYPQKLERRRLHFAFSLPRVFISEFRNIWFVFFFLLRYAKWHWTNYHAAGRHLLKMVLLHPYYEKNFAFDVWMKDDMLHLLPRIEFRKGVDVSRVLREFFEHFAYRYDALVYVEVQYTQIQKRFEERFKMRPAALRENRIVVYKRAHSQNKILKEVLLAQKKVPVLELDGRDSISSNAKKAALFIRNTIHEKT